VRTATLCFGHCGAESPSQAASFFVWSCQCDCVCSEFVNLSMAVSSGDISCSGNTLDLLELLGLPLDFGSAVLYADALCEPPPSVNPTLSATACSASASKPSAAEHSERILSGDLFSRAYSCTEHGMCPPSVQVRRCGDGKGWGLFALANFAANDVLFVEAPMFCVAEPETSNLHCNNCMRSFCPPPPFVSHAQLWTTDAHISCSRGGDSCCAIYCNAFCR
jgi:hypothetical protein